MRQLDCQGQFGWVVACLLILRLPAFRRGVDDDCGPGQRAQGIVAPIPVGRMAKPSEMEAVMLILLRGDANYTAEA